MDLYSRLQEEQKVIEARGMSPLFPCHSSPHNLSKMASTNSGGIIPLETLSGELIGAYRGLTEHCNRRGVHGSTAEAH